MSGDAATAVEAKPVTVLFCGDREVSTKLLQRIRNGGGVIAGLGLNAIPSRFTAAVRDAAGLDPGMVFYGRSFFGDVAMQKFEAVEADLGVSCGFADIIPKAMLGLPRWGWVNLHRSYLPYNRGLDPLQWALVDGTPAGVTLHVMTDQVDAGPIIAQSEMPILPTDDYDALEARSDELVFSLFDSCWPRLRAGDLTGTPQDESLATYHSLADCDALRRLDLRATMPVGRLLNILRGYSGRYGSTVEFQVGLLRARFAAHTQIRMVADGCTPRPGDAATPASAVHDADDQ